SKAFPCRVSRRSGPRCSTSPRWSIRWGPGTRWRRRCGSTWCCRASGPQALTAPAQRCSRQRQPRCAQARSAEAARRASAQRFKSGVDQDDTEIVDVCLRGTKDDEPAGSLEEAGGVVIVEELLGVEVARTCERSRLDHGARWVRDLAGAPVDAVRVGRQRRDAGEAAECQSQRQRILLVAP